MVLSVDPYLPTPPCAMDLFQDVSDIAALLASASQRYEQLFHGLPVACFCFDSCGRITEWNKAGAGMFQSDPGAALQQPVWEVIGCREDRELTQALIQSVLSGIAYQDFEWNDYGPDGCRRDFLSSIFPLRNEGTLIGGISASIDISARKQAEIALWESEERWQLAVRGSNDGLWDWNVRTGATFFSLRWKQMVGLEDEDVPVGREDWLGWLHPDDEAGVGLSLQAHLNRETEFYHAEYRLRCRDGEYRWFLDRGQALWSRTGEALRVAGSLTDITERKLNERRLEEANLRLQALATEDGLTGLKNHRAFQDRLTIEYGRAPRYSFPLSLCLVDVDQFKHYNDTFGHPEGDQVLMRVGALLSQSVRETDFVARYGGEEFVLLLPHTDQQGAQIVAERCRLAIQNEKWPHRAVTISLGVCTLTPDTKSQADLVSAADKALYMAKSDGRNRVLCSGDARLS